MSHFYGTLQGNRGEATRAGTKGSGIDCTAASWRGAINTHLFIDPDTGVDMAEVTQGKWQGAGASPERQLYFGPVNPEDQKIIDAYKLKMQRQREDDANPLTAKHPPKMEPRGPLEPDPTGPPEPIGETRKRLATAGPIEVCEDCRTVMASLPAGAQYARPILCSTCDDAAAAAALYGCVDRVDNLGNGAMA